MGDPSQQDIANALKLVGVSDANAAAAAQQYSVIDANVSDGVKQVAAAAGSINTSNAPATLMSVAPIIGAGLAMTGIGAPAAAIVTAGIGVVAGILSALGLNNAKPEPKCAWRAILDDEQTYYQARNITDEPYLGYCVDPSREIPFGPNDTTGWRSITTLSPDDIQKLAPGGWTFGMWPHIPNGSGGIEDQLQEQYNPSFDHRLDAFLQAFRIVWLANAERSLNGHKSAGQFVLLLAFLNGHAGHGGAWNDQHAGPAVTVSADDPSGGPLSDLLKGDYDGQRQAPLTINVGPQLHVVTLHHLNAAKPTLSKGALLAATGVSPTAKPVRHFFNAWTVGTIASVAVLLTHRVVTGHWWLRPK